jgi:Fur family transcriptional regulator, ferric uptake regulator
VNHLGAVDVAVTPLDKYREFLALSGKRLTPERNTIVEEVFSSHDHFDTDQLVARLANRGDGRSVSRSTVYRRLTELVDAGLLRKVARHNDREVYEHDYGYPQHDHFICKKCGSMTEFHNVSISRVLEEVAEGYGFHIDGHRLEVYGLCEACSRAPKSRHRKLDMI